MFASNHPSFFEKLLFFLFKNGLFVLVVFFLYSFFSDKNWEHYFPIREVSVFGARQSYPDQVKKAVLPFLNQGFFFISLDAMKDHIENLPWVSSVVVKKVWPQQLEIWLEEKKAIALWNDHNLLTENGELFKPEFNNHSKKLPKLVGMHGNHVKILRQYNLFKEHLHSINQNVVYVEETPFSDWKVQLENGVVLYVGDNDIVSRLQRLIDVYAKVIGDRAKEVDYVDLRYANGVAVRWKNG